MGSYFVVFQLPFGSPFIRLTNAPCLNPLAATVAVFYSFAVSLPPDSLMLASISFLIFALVLGSPGVPDPWESLKVLRVSQHTCA